MAFPYVPTQGSNAPRYENGRALERGTLFPGLDLPFMNIANQDNPYAGTPLGELMGLDFAIQELKLYLDTHRKDQEAFQMLKTLIEMYRDGKKEYVSKFGPLNVCGLTESETYSWLRGPWPWEYRETEQPNVQL